MNPKRKATTPRQRPRRAQLVADSFSVCCAYCGEPQPNHDGSEMWTADDFAKNDTARDCVSCDAPMLISYDPHAQIAPARK